MHLQQIPSWQRGEQLEGRTAIQRAINSLEKPANRNLTNFNISK